VARKKQERSQFFLKYQRDVRLDKNADLFMAFQFKNAAGEKKRILTQRSNIGHVDRVVDELNNAGAILPTDPKAAKALIEGLVHAGPRFRNLHVTERVGWAEGDQFVFPDKTLSSSGISNVRHRDGYLIGAMPDCRGTLRGWRTAVSPLFDMSHFSVFAVGLGLSGPLLNLLPARSGLAFQLTGDSGVGKTSLLVIAESVVKYSHPEAVRTLNSTPTFFEEVGWANCDGFVGFDEFGAAVGAGTALSELISDIAFKMRDGKGRDRGKAGAKGTGQSGLRFRVVTLTTAEKSLEEMAGKPRGEGEVIRYIQIFLPKKEEKGIFGSSPFEVTLDEKARDEFLSRLVTQLESNHGVAHRKMASALVKNREHWSEKIRRWMDELDRQLSSASFARVQSRYRTAFCTVYAALMLAAELKIIELPPDRIEQSVLSVYRCSELQGGQQRQGEDLISKLVNLLDEPQNCEHTEKGGVRSNPTAWAVMRTANGKKCCFVDPQGLSLALGTDVAQRIENILLARQIQIRDPRGKSRQQVAGTGLGTSRRPRLMVVDMDRLRSAAELRSP
jgi:hypothetical protein|tara:strand:+ start:2351 stop:4027 length:1677 start_codon:yes stop_codon:yes gene_type:complete